MENQIKDSLQTPVVVFEMVRSHLLQNATNITNKFQAQFQNPMEQLTRLNLPIIDFSAKLEEQLARTTNAIAKLYIPTIDFSSPLKAFNESLREAFDSLNPVFAKASGVMSDNGWWLIGFLSIDFYRKLIKIEGQVTPEKLAECITRCANRRRCEQLVSVVKQWDLDVFEARKEHFEQALWAHSRGKYALTVPALVCHVEGIIIDFIEIHDGGFTAWDFERVRERLKRKFSQIQKAPPKNKLGFAEARALMNYHNLKALEKLYAPHSPTSHADPSDVNRHALNHGLWLGYSTKETSTKLFLLLDLLHSMLRQLRKT